MMSEKVSAAIQRSTERFNSVEKKYVVNLVYSGSYDNKSPQQIKQNPYAAAALAFADLTYLTLMTQYEEADVYYPRYDLLGGVSLFEEFERVTKSSRVTLAIITQDIRNNPWFNWLTKMIAKREHDQRTVSCIIVCLPGVDKIFMEQYVDYFTEKFIICLDKDYTNVKEFEASEEFRNILKSIENIKEKQRFSEEETGGTEADIENDNSYALAINFERPSEAERFPNAQPSVESFGIDRLDSKSTATPEKPESYRALTGYTEHDYTEHNLETSQPTTVSRSEIETTNQEDNEYSANIVANGVTQHATDNSNDLEVQKENGNCNLYAVVGIASIALVVGFFFGRRIGR